MWELVPLSKVSWEEGVSEGWMVCPFLEELLGASGSWGHSAGGTGVC